MIQFYYFIYFLPHNQFMEYQNVHKILLELNLNVDPNTTLKIVNFINNQIGFDSTQPLLIQKYYIYAALAIVSQQDRIPTIDGKFMTSNGIQIQQIMNYLGGLQIENYLNYVQNLIKKYRKANEPLIFKVNNLKLAYRIFKKYKKICNSILEVINQQYSQLIADFQCFVWILFLYWKQQKHYDYQLIEQTQFLCSVIKLCWSLLSIPINQNELNDLVQKEFNCKFETNQNQTKFKQRIQQILNQIKCLRHRQNQDLNLLLSNSSIRTRFLDDLTNEYNKMKLALKYHFIDQIKFLKNNKVIPPEKIIVEEGDSNYNFTNKKINFQTLEIQALQQKQQKIVQPQINFSNFKPSIMVSPILKRKGFVQISPLPTKSQYTPISSKINESQWINKKISNYSSADQSQLVRIFVDANLCYKNVYDNFQICLKKILSIYNNGSIVQLRVKKILKLFQSFLLGLAKTVERQQRADLIKNQQFLRGLICLIADIYFFANSLQVQQIRQFSLKFGIQYMQVFKLINKIGKFDKQMPNNIRLHLLQMQRLILLLYIWQQGKGYTIIISKNLNKSYYGKVIEDRLQKHIYSRIIEIHNSMDIPESYQEKTKSVLSYILNQKPQLLKKNYIDQIIICCLYSVLKMNMQNQYTLQLLFSKYNKLQLSYNSHKFIVYDKNNQQINLLNFYNKVFQPQIKQAFSNSTLNHKFLVTPIKKQFDMHIGQSKSPFHRRLENPQSEQYFKFNNSINFDQVAPANKMYQRNLAKRLNNIILFQNNKPSQTVSQQHTPKFNNIRRLASQKQQDLNNSAFKLFNLGSFDTIQKEKKQ